MKIYYNKYYNNLEEDNPQILKIINSKLNSNNNIRINF